MGSAATARAPRCGCSRSVRTVEKAAEVPDGRFGPQTQAHLALDDEGPGYRMGAHDRTMAGRHARPDRVHRMVVDAREGEGEVSGVSRTEMLRLVDAFARPTDTRKVADWNFDPNAIHLVGIRRNEKINKFDDLFAVLIKGLVFKFQGSTDPGATSNPLGAPFLVQGQHAYHFGWHKNQHLAVRPSDNRCPGRAIEGRFPAG